MRRLGDGRRIERSQARRHDSLGGHGDQVRRPGARRQHEVLSAEGIERDVGRVDATGPQREAGGLVLVEPLDVEPFALDEQLAGGTGASDRPHLVLVWPVDQVDEPPDNVAGIAARPAPRLRVRAPRARG